MAGTREKVEQVERDVSCARDGENGLWRIRPREAPRVDGLASHAMSLGSVLDEIPIGVAILDAERRIRVTNRAFDALTGFSGDQVQGLPCRYITRTNLCQRTCVADEALAGGRPVSLEGDMVNRERRKINVRVTATPLYDNAGEVCGFLETVEELGRGAESAFSGGAGMFKRVLGRSPQMAEVFRVLPAVAQTGSSVLITGETGTGKDLLAEGIHEASQRAHGPFIKVNCGALPETLLESELFGHTKGAFTGAVSDKPGRLRMAHGGTLFLTEIGDLPLPLQVKLLTFLDDQIVFPLGASKGFQADVRVIAATHRDLHQMVRDNQFRKDLLYRLNVVRVHLPPLREREGDVRLLMDHFIKEFSQCFNKKITGFSQEAATLLGSYPYPGNVREMRNIIEYSVGVAQGDRILFEHLPAYLTTLPDPGGLEPEQKEPDRVTSARKLSAVVGEMDWPAVERAMILDALVQSKGHKTRAAEILGWGRSTLWRKMKQYGLG
ncbi:MAG: sigma-54 interaction domain-containing protein [Desulfatibacillaceae bacterium]